MNEILNEYKVQGSRGDKKKYWGTDNREPSKPHKNFKLCPKGSQKASMDL